MSMLTETQERNFWNKVNKTAGCWEWTANKRKGYGLFRVGNKVVSAHRLAYELEYGVYEGQVLHSCDNTICVRPDHLFLGDATSNMQDMYSKDRQNRSLSNQDVADIRLRISEGETMSSLVKEYKVSRGTLSNAARGKTFKHVDFVPAETSWRGYKLSKQDYDEIIEALKTPRWGQVTELAKRYGVSQPTISRLKKHPGVSYANFKEYSKK